MATFSLINLHSGPIRLAVCFSTVYNNQIPLNPAIDVTALPVDHFRIIELYGYTEEDLKLEREKHPFTEIVAELERERDAGREREGKGREEALRMLGL